MGEVNNMDRDKWIYLNKMPSRIPLDISKLSKEEKNKLLEEWSEAIWTKNTQASEQKLQNIKDLKIIKVTVPVWIMDRLKEAEDHYVNGQWLSTIAVCGIIGEFISYYYIEKHIKERDISKIIKNSRKMKIYNQDGRLKLLKKLESIKEENYEKLDDIRKIRNKYIHINILDDQDIAKSDSLKVLKDLIQFLNLENPMFTNYPSYSKEVKKHNEEVEKLKND